MSAGNGRSEALAAALEALARAVREAGEASAPTVRATEPSGPVSLPWSVLLWREDLVPPETLLTLAQLIEATGWTKAAIYRRTSRWHREHGTCAPLPHVRLAGSLRFRAGELRRWFSEHTETVVAGRGPVVVSERRGRGVT